MHVLPLPFGTAIALLPRREAERLREPKEVPLIERRGHPRERLLGDSRYAAVGRRVV
jgi:hypothetical protein